MSNFSIFRYFWKTGKILPNFCIFCPFSRGHSTPRKSARGPELLWVNVSRQELFPYVQPFFDIILPFNLKNGLKDAEFCQFFAKMENLAKFSHLSPQNTRITIKLDAESYSTVKTTLTCCLYAVLVKILKNCEKSQKSKNGYKSPFWGSRRLGEGI